VKIKYREIHQHRYIICLTGQDYGALEWIIVFGVISFFQRWWPLYNSQVHQLFLWLIISEDTWWLFCILSPKTLGRYSVYYLRRPLVVILYIISEDNWWLFCILSLKTLGGYSVYYLWRHLVIIPDTISEDTWWLFCISSPNALGDYSEKGPGGSMS
jgi:hypothetical protein